ncbi:MAG: hypothetical protein ABIO70_01630 [Pseudomonadota bacterium]
MPIHAYVPPPVQPLLQAAMQRLQAAPDPGIVEAFNALAYALNGGAPWPYVEDAGRKLAAKLDARP